MEENKQKSFEKKPVFDTLSTSYVDPKLVLSCLEGEIGMFERVQIRGGENHSFEFDTRLTNAESRNGLKKSVISIIFSSFDRKGCLYGSSHV